MVFNLSEGSKCPGFFLLIWILGEHIRSVWNTQDYYALLFWILLYCLWLSCVIAGRIFLHQKHTFSHAGPKSRTQSIKSLKKVDFSWFYYSAMNKRFTTRKQGFLLFLTHFNWNKPLLPTIRGSQKYHLQFFYSL